MRGPINYIIVEFKGNNFKGEILAELSKAVEQGVIAVLDLAVIAKDKEGNVASVELGTVNSELAQNIAKAKVGLINEEDVAEVGELLDNDCAAGLLIVEQLWAKGLKQAIINANGSLIAEGRIHPDAEKELDSKGE